MNDWNVVITVHEPYFSDAIKLLQEYGTILKTEYFNVLAMHVDDTHNMAEKLRKQIVAEPGLLNILARIVPAARTFNFQTPEEFEKLAQKIVLEWVPKLAGKKFHVRMHRRGFKKRLSSMQEESFLDKILLDALNQTDNPGFMEFDDPDVIISVETIGQRAGLSLWTKEELTKYPFLRLD